jgi:hypothetical protein
MVFGRTTNGESAHNFLVVNNFESEGGLFERDCFGHDKCPIHLLALCYNAARLTSSRGRQCRLWCSRQLARG